MHRCLITAAAAEGQKLTYSRDELWKTVGSQTLQSAWEFVKRVAELKTEKKFSDQKEVQQILFYTTKENLHKQGISEFNCSV